MYRNTSNKNYQKTIILLNKSEWNDIVEIKYKTMVIIYNTKNVNKSCHLRRKYNFNCFFLVK